MKPRNIEKHLRGKISDWLESIEDEQVREVAAKGTIVMGGAIASLILGERPHDYDIYFKDKETTWAVAEYYVDKFKANPPAQFRREGEEIPIDLVDDDGRIKVVVKSAGVVGEEAGEYAYFEADPDPTDQAAFLETVFTVAEEEAEEEKPPYRPIFLSTNAITLSDKVQMVIRFYGSPSDVKSTYDFLHVTGYWCSWTNKLSIAKDALWALLNKELVVINGGTQYPIAAICRIRKFLNRGFHIVAGQVLKLCFAVCELDLSDYTVLEDQLTGVDWAYFQELLSYIRANKDECMEDGKMRLPYVMELIDRLL